LREHSQPDDRLLAYEIGAVGYASGLHVIDHEGLASPAVAQIVYRAGGYGPVRMGREPSAMQRIMSYCEAQRPDWFLVSSISPTELRVGEPAPFGVSDEPIQNAFIESFGDDMIVARWFDLGPAGESEPHRYILLKRRSRD
jgi:hypothetical protein